MKYKYEILALLGLIALLIVYYSYFHNKNLQEGIDIEGDLDQLKKDSKLESKNFIKKQQTHFGARKIQSLEQGAFADTIFLKVSEDKDKTDYKQGKIGLEKDYSAYDIDESEFRKRIQKCIDIDKIKDCSQLEGMYYDDGTGCGYCLDSDKIIFGGPKAPADPNNPGKYSNDVCGGGGQKNTWIPPGKDAAFQCQKAKDRAYCNRMKDCGDTTVADRCAWCPVKGKGMAKKLKDGGFHPKYKDDKCEWPYTGIKTNVKWFGWSPDSQKYGGTDVAAGDCDTDADCAPGLKCGQNPHRTRNTKGLKGSRTNLDGGKDYCYDPEFAGMNGPLVPVGECVKFGQKFPCMGPKMNTGPHSTACLKDLWKKSGCRNDVMKATSDQGSFGTNLINLWNKSSFGNVLNSMIDINNKVRSKDYAEAKRMTKMCYDRDVDPCEERFVDESKKKKRPRDCLVNTYNQSGCSVAGRLHPDKISQTVKEDARKRHGVKKEWETGTFYRWKPKDYLNKLRDVKQRADKYTSTSNINTYDEGIKLYENCYGKAPSTTTYPMKKPCWKDFTEIMKRSHKNVVISDDENSIVYSRDSLGVNNNFMKDSNLNRSRLAGKNLVGHDWGDSKTIKKSDYKKPFFPFWQFVTNSRAIYQGGANLVASGEPNKSLALSAAECKKYAQSIGEKYRAGAWRSDPPKCFRCTPGRCSHGREQGHVFYNRRNTNNKCGANQYDCVEKMTKGTKPGAGEWNNFKRRALKISGVEKLDEDALTFATFMGVGRTLRNYGLAKKRTLAHLPVNGKCSSCNLIPKGQCQEGCPGSYLPGGSRNFCRTIGGIRNKGKKPSSCIVPDGNVLTKEMWMKPDFPYWEFMRILQRFEKN
jgi:hypothetical protein